MPVSLLLARHARSSLVVSCRKGNAGDSDFSNGRSAASTNGKIEGPPRRITDTSQRSLKAQLRYVKQLKKAEASEAGRGFAPAQRSAFRRKRESAKKAENSDMTATNSTTASKISELALEEQQLSRGRGISSLYNTKAMTNPPAVLVDGYNVLMLWLSDPGDELRKSRVRGCLEAGRLEILRDLSDYSGWRNLRMMVAFDAQGNPDAPDIARDQVGGVETVYVGTGEADSFIIGEARQLRLSGCPYVLVASSDNDIRDSCWTNEIFPVSSAQLLKEIRKAKKEADLFYRESVSRLRTDRVGAGLMRRNPDLYARLEKARIKSLRGS